LRSKAFSKVYKADKNVGEVDLFRKEEFRNIADDSTGPDNGFLFRPLPRQTVMCDKLATWQTHSLSLWLRTEKMRMTSSSLQRYEQ
jgi:hypothetical protein